MNAQDATQTPGRPWVGALTEHADFVAASELYQRVFAYSSASYALNANLLTALVHNAGTAVGARSPQGDLIGFAYGFMGVEGDEVYHYSQAAVVDPAWQGHGLGRRLKLAQGEMVLALGVTHMRWAYNPVFARNGHFNLNSLGGIAIDFLPDYYGRPDTDRLLVDWALDGSHEIYRDLRRLCPPSSIMGAPVGTAVAAEEVLGGSWVVLPAHHVAGAHDDGAREAGRALREGLLDVFAGGGVLVSCVKVDADTAVYLCAPRARTMALVEEGGEAA